MTLPDRLATALADRYHFERELGAGGMATVYLAEDLKHKRKVAIKVLKPELAAVLGAERFVQEITTTASLQHPHILPLFDSGEASGFLYYVMPYIQGETIREKLNRETQFGIEEAIRITTEVADALDYAHRQGVIHRDIKPENLLLHDGRAMVMDFGIALAVSAAAGGRMTETGLSLGTPHYMSPEQATAEKEITGRSDVYSLASVCYEMLAGQPPHLGGSAQQIIMKIIAEPAPQLTTLRRSVPPNVAAAIGKALEKLPADRFETARAFADALTDPHFTTRSATTVGGSGGRPAVRHWLRDPRTVTLGVVAVAAIAATSWARLDTSATALGPTSYDVVLPDSAPLAITLQQSFDVAPSGDFIVYQAREPRGKTLWYRSLRDDVTRRIDGTTGGQRPAISPDGSRVAFVRADAGAKWSLEVVPVAGGVAAALGNGVGDVNVQWLDDGRIQVLEGDGNHVRWFDPEAGKTDSRRTAFCQLPVYLEGRDEFLCSGARLFAWRIAFGDSLRERDVFLTDAPDSSQVFGADFRVVEGKYLVYVSVGGDLLAAPVDLTTGRVGRSVRFFTGIGRSDFLGAGIYSLSHSGTLVYSEGANRAVGNLVATDGRTTDTLNVGRDAFRLFAMSPDSRRLAAVVDGLQGQELRVYDLQVGAPVVIARGVSISQPVWNSRGDRLLFARTDSIFVSEVDRTEPPRLVAVAPARFEAFSWGVGDRVVGSLWETYHAVSLDIAKSPVVWDTLATSASFPVESPDGRWMAYSDPDMANIWVSPLPTTGQRYQVATGSVAEPQWRSDREIVINVFDDSTLVLRMGMDTSRPTPVFSRLGTVALPGYVETAGVSYGLTPDGRILHVRTVTEEPKRFLRVVPNWVTLMKRAVDEANR